MSLLGCGGLWLAYTQAPQPSKLNVVKLADDLFVIHNDYVPGNTTALIQTKASSSWTTNFRKMPTISFRR
jgi:hypothetical protein